MDRSIDRFVERDGSFPSWLMHWRPAREDIPAVWIHPFESIAMKVKWMDGLGYKDGLDIERWMDR